MKLIDKEGRIFGKINILDFIAIVLALFLLLLAVLKVFNAQLSNLTAESELVTIEVKVSAVMDKGYFDVVKVGDRLGEVKQYIDATVTDVEILPVEETHLDEDGNTVVSTNPLQEKAIVTFEATLPYENYKYKFGSQELRQGKTINLESDLYRYEAQIISIKVVE